MRETIASSSSYAHHAPPTFFAIPAGATFGFLAGFSFSTGSAAAATSGFGALGRLFPLAAFFGAFKPLKYLDNMLCVVSARCIHFVGLLPEEYVGFLGLVSACSIDAPVSVIAFLLYRVSLPSS
jgi:hypothetical protein